jgi:hypothetical protein
MQLLPESVRSTSTTALDATWATRIELLRYERLAIDLLTETNATKLEMWLEMFGVSKSSFEGLSTEEYKRLLQYIIVILRLSGTPKSIKLLGLVLGATSVTIVQDYTFKYDGAWSFDGSNLFDGGDITKRFIIRLTITGIAPENRESFIEKLRRLFEVSQPVWIYLERVDFV